MWEHHPDFLNDGYKSFCLLQVCCPSWHVWGRFPHVPLCTLLLLLVLGGFLLLLGKWFLHNSCATIRLKPFLHCQQLFSRDCVTFWRCMRSFLRSGPASQVYGSCTEKNKTLCRNACVAAGQAHSSEPEISRSLQADHVQLPLLLFNKWGVPSALPLKYSVFTILKWPFTPAVSAEQRDTHLYFSYIQDLKQFDHRLN